MCLVFDQGYRAFKCHVHGNNPFQDGSADAESWRDGYLAALKETLNLHDEQDSGFDAFCAGKPISENPHEHDTVDFEQWEEGWEIAADEAYDVK